MLIPEIATQKVNEILSQLNENTAKTIFLIGNKSVGKTTLLYSFLERTENPRETLLLEYYFSRNASHKQGVEKTICHLWDYGGKLELLKSVLSSVQICGKWYFCIMLDLSKIKSFWEVLETAIIYINDTTTNIENNAELIIIGGKYDLFKNYDSEIKKHVCTTLRSIALLYNTHLIFYSNKEQPLVKRTKDLFQNIASGENNVLYKEKNVTYFAKPLLVAKGSDNWESIGISASTFEQIKARHISRFMPEIYEDIAKTVEDGDKNAYPEPILDSLAALKMEDFNHLSIKDI